MARNRAVERFSTRVLYFQKSKNSSKAKINLKKKLKIVLKNVKANEFCVIRSNFCAEISGESIFSKFTQLSSDALVCSCSIRTIIIKCSLYTTLMTMCSRISTFQTHTIKAMREQFVIVQLFVSVNSCAKSYKMQTTTTIRKSERANKKK